MGEYEKCEVCNEKVDLDYNGILNLQEILECSDNRVAEWEKENPNIDLYNYFCWECTEKIGREIENAKK